MNPFASVLNVLKWLFSFTRVFAARVCVALLSLCLHWFSAWSLCGVVMFAPLTFGFCSSFFSFSLNFEGGVGIDMYL